jgi:hypothetical protein
VILLFSVVGIFTDKWHNKDYLKSIGVTEEQQSDRPPIDYSIMIIVLIGFASEVLQIFIQIFSSIFCSKKSDNNLRKIAPWAKSEEVKLDSSSIQELNFLE